MIDIRWEVIGFQAGTSIELDNVSAPSNYALEGQEIQIRERTVVSIGEPEQSVIVASDNIFQLPISIRNITGPDIIVYTLDIRYDPAFVLPIACEGHPDTSFDPNQCNPEFTSGVIRLSGVNPSGTQEDAILAETEWMVVGPPVDETNLVVEVVTLVDNAGNSLGYATRDQVVKIIQIDPSLTIGNQDSSDLRVVEGQTFTTPLEIFDISPDNPMGGISLEVHYTPDLFQPTRCENHSDADFAKVLCNFEGEPGRIRLNGTSKVGVSGDAGLAIINRVDSQAELGALTASLAYDRDQFRAIACQMVESEEDNSGICNLNRDENHIQFNTVMPAGASGSRQLVDITFEHVGATVDMSAFALDVSTLANKEGERLPFTIDEDVKVYLPVVMR